MRKTKEDDAFSNFFVWVLLEKAPAFVRVLFMILSIAVSVTLVLWLTPRKHAAAKNHVGKTASARLPNCFI